jgi:hypothetical protein
MMDKTNMEVKIKPKRLLQNSHASSFRRIAMCNRKLISSFTQLAARVQDGHAVMKRYSIEQASCVFAASTSEG